MRTIHNAQNAFFATNSDKFLKGEAYTRITDDRIEDRSTNSQSFIPGTSDRFAKAALEFILGDGIVKIHFSSLEGAMFLHGDDAFLHGSVDGFEIDERVFGLEV